jgi:hypothetical protein
MDVGEGCGERVQLSVVRGWRALRKRNPNTPESSLSTPRVDWIEW